jgi:bifunctional ADP-heptose synthase (sugar kinase/adenylyltransferase)
MDGKIMEKLGIVDVLHAIQGRLVAPKSQRNDFGKYNYRNCEDILEALKPVDEVIVFRSKEELIDLVSKCDIMVKGSDYIGKSIIGETYCKKVVYYDRTEHSTTKTIQRITDR